VTWPSRQHRAADPKRAPGCRRWRRVGVAAIVAVLGLATSSSAALLNEIARLGTNLLTVTNGRLLRRHRQAARGGTGHHPAVGHRGTDIGLVGGVSA
jgi:hypothetical protein